MAVVAQISSVFVVVAYAFRLCCSFSGPAGSHSRSAEEESLLRFNDSVSRDGALTDI
jgi:hypothetical protein